MNTFDAENHEYRIAGKLVPSVTQILNETLGNPFDWITDPEWYMGRGRAVHAYAAMMAQNKDFEPPDERIAGRVEALRKWFADIDPRHCVAEYNVFSKRYQFAGTYDLSFEMHATGAFFLADFKSSSDIGRTMLQIAGYSVAAGWESCRPSCRPLGVEIVLRDNGDYKMSEPLELKAAQQEFLALRATYGIKERLGVLTKKKGE